MPELTPSISSGNSSNEHVPTPIEPSSAPPAYPGTSPKSTRRSSWSARNDPNGTIVRPSDVGNGSDTLRPFKRVDTAGSMRISADFVGSVRKPGDESSPTNGTSSHSRKQSDYTRAGAAMVSEVIVPTIQSVSFDLYKLVSSSTQIF